MSEKMQKLISLYIEQSSMSDVQFDKISVTESNKKTVLLSSQGLSKGVHEWDVEILRSDVDLQEFGVIGTNLIERIPVRDDGVMATFKFKSRAVYGSDLSSGKLFYGSWNANGKKRCHRDLTPYFQVQVLPHYIRPS